MDVMDACFHMVHDAPGGATGLAARMGKAAATLSHEVDPNYPSAKFGVVDLCKAMAFTGDHRPLHAMGAKFQYRLVRIDESIGDGNLDALFQQYVLLTKEVGEAQEAFHTAVKDGRITENEIEAFEKQLADIQVVGAAVAAAMRTVARQQALERATGQ